MRKMLLLIGVCCLFVGLQAFGQTHLDLRIDPDEATLRKSEWPDREQKDSLSAIRSLNQWLSRCYDTGYLGASVDSLAGNRDTLIVFLHIGPRYRWNKLMNGNLEEGMLSETGFRSKYFNGKPLEAGSIGDWNSRILKYCEDHGYPFASIRYDGFRFEEDGVSATVYLEKEKLITIDSIIIRGNCRLTRPYLYSYLSIKPGDVYNESLIRRVPARMRELPMVTETRAFQVAFTEETARLVLYADNKKASQVDGIIGFQPDYRQSGKVQLTGDIRLRLLSSFGHGELFDLNWRQPAPLTQDLKVRINYPFLFSTPFGVEGNLAIYKKDTSYLEVILGAAIQYQLTGGSYIKALVENKKSTLLSTTQYQFATVLPPFADVEITSYGLSFKKVKLDYRFNPRKGFNFECTGTAGNKTISRNGKLNAELYDSLELKSVQYRGDVHLDWYFPLFSRNVLLTGISASGVGGENLFDNEMIRFGGLHTLRGFDEEALLATLYVMGNLEFRYILEQNSNLFVFFNGAWYERSGRSEYRSDTPIGFGAGITFETKLGIFSISYALGKEADNPVRFKAAKVHFGIVNYF